MNNQVQETYPAYKQSKFDEVIDLIQTTNGKEISHNDWRLPSTRRPKEDCGKWKFKGCLDVKAHAKSDFKGKVFVKTFQKCCFRASCELCVKKWAGREANKATRRIEKYTKLSKKPAKHIIVSPPSWHHNLDHKTMKKEAYRILKKVGALGGAMIFHPFRFNQLEQFWYYSPHFHVLGFGWLEGSEEIYNKEGWIVKNKGLRNSVFGTFLYQLSHCGIKEHTHSLVWFGDLSYSKLKMEKEPETDICPICNAKLRPLYYCGLLGAPPPECECEIFVDPDGWHLLENKPRIIERREKSFKEKWNERINRELYHANKGVYLN
ncbi:MAG: hypothetical protein ACREBB_11815 [Nitrosotalea sp.]